MLGVFDFPLVNKFLRFVCRFDLGFLIVRLSLFLPVLAFSYGNADSVEQFSEFSQVFHTCLFLSGFVIFGFHERGVVVGFRNTIDEFSIVGFRSLLMALFVIVLFYGEGFWLVLSIVAYILVFRVGALFGFVRFQDQPVNYSLLAVFVGALGLSPFLSWYSVLFVLALVVLLLVWVVSLDFKRFLDRFFMSHVEDAPYATNLVMSSFFMQGSLMVFALFSSPHALAKATSFIYLVNAGVILQSFLYRAMMKSFIKRDLGLTKPLILSMGLACVIIALYGVFGGAIERTLLSVNRLDSFDFIFVSLIVFAHSLSFVLSSYLVSTRNISVQLFITALSSLSICLCCFIYYFTEGAFEFPVFMAAVSFLFCLVRVVKVYSIIRSDLK